MTRDSIAEFDLEKQIRRVRFLVFDFDGVFTDNTVYVFSDGAEAVRCWRGDGIGLRKLERLGIDLIIISTETHPIVEVRARKLGIRVLQGIEDKLAALRRLLTEKALSFEQVAYVGNDINDLSCLTTVGLPIVVRDAHPDVLSVARYCTRAMGGKGAVREVADLFEKVLAG